MAPLKQKGDLAEMMVAADLLRRGHRIAFPHGEDWDYDHIVERAGQLERVQVKYATSDGRVVPVRCYAVSVTNGRVCNTKHYTSETIDWMAVYDVTTDCCYYLPASELGAGRSTLRLRLTPALSGRRKGIRNAVDYLSI